MAWFTADFNKFFKELAANNNKEWFDAHRKRYEQSVKEPFAAFTGEMIQRIGRLDKNVSITPREAIFRINRDIRFSKDKTPYKLNCSAIISPAGRSDHAVPGIYYELGPEAVRIYGGAYQPGKPQLEAIRHAIMRDPRSFRKVIDPAAFKKHFTAVRGEKNKVLPAPFKQAVAREPLIAYKQFYVRTELPPDSVTDPALADMMLVHFKAMQPFNDWLTKAMK